MKRVIRSFSIGLAVVVCFLFPNVAVRAQDSSEAGGVFTNGSIALVADPLPDSGAFLQISSGATLSFNSSDIIPIGGEPGYYFGSDDLILIGGGLIHFLDIDDSTPILNGDGQIDVLPEPATWLLTLLSLGTILGIRRLRH